MREVIMGLLLVVLLSGFGYLVNRDAKNAEKEHEKVTETYTHLAPKVKALSVASGNKNEATYQYVQDQMTGLCFIERNNGYRGGMAMIPCEAIPTK